MKRCKRLFLAFASAWLAVGVVAAARPHYGGTLVVETRAPLRSLDPAADPTDAAEAVARSHLVPLVFETLVEVDPSGGLRPGLAVGWEDDRRGARWRFRLRPGVKLHDGSTLEPLQVAAELRARDDWQVSADGDAIVVDTTRARPDLPWMLSEVRNAIAVRRGSGGMVGTGPFRVERLEPGRLMLRAHEDYWNGRPFLDGVQVGLARPGANQLVNLEQGRSDIVDVQPIDARRVSQRRLRVLSSRPIELFALLFEPHRATDASGPLRLALASAIDRSAMCRVLLQGRAEPADALLPGWLSGYAPFVAAADTEVPHARAATALPAEQRALTLRADGADPLALAIAERIAVDARQAGLSIKTQTPAGLAPRPDLRLVRLRLEVTSPDRALAAIVSALGSRTIDLATRATPPSAGSPLDAGYRFERALVERQVIIPLVHVPDLYGVGDRVGFWNGPPVLASGGWNLANVWLDSNTPDHRQ